MNAEMSTPSIEHHEPPWLEVTNFAIDYQFMEIARSAVDPQELKQKLTAGRFFELCCLWDDSRPELERRSFVSESTYQREYWQRVYGMLPELTVALNVVRDILWFHKIQYDSNKREFAAPPEMMPLWSRMRLALISGITSGMFGSVRNAEELSNSALRS